MENGQPRTFLLKRRAAHYLFGFALLSLYGGQVCPFLESLSLIQLTLPILTVLVLQYLIGVFWLETTVNRRSYQLQSRALFRGELFVFIGGAAGVHLHPDPFLRPELQPVSIPGNQRVETCHQR
jgi:biotin transporter BioY